MVEKKVLLPHEDAAGLIKFIGYFAGLVSALIIAFIIIPEINNGAFQSDMGRSLSWLVFLIIIPFAIMTLANGVKNHSSWARVAGLIWAVLLLFGFPIGTIIGVYLIRYLGFKWN